MLFLQQGGWHQQRPRSYLAQVLQLFAGGCSFEGLWREFSLVEEERMADLMSPSKTLPSSLGRVGIEIVLQANTKPRGRDEKHPFRDHWSPLHADTNDAADSLKINRRRFGNPLPACRQRPLNSTVDIPCCEARTHVAGGADH